MTAQQLALFLYLLIIALTLLAIKLKPSKRPSLYSWLAYGVLGFAYYVAVLFFGFKGHEMSSTLRTVQSAIVASNILGYFVLGVDEHE